MTIDIEVSGPYLRALDWAKALQLRCPTSPHHQRCVEELWAWIEPLCVKRVLELGCGEPPSPVLDLLRRHGIEAVGLDGMAACDCPGDMHALPFEDNSFDLVIARNSLEHCIAPYVALFEMKRVTRRYALLVLPDNNRKFTDWPDHLNVYDRNGWENIFRRVGLTVSCFGIEDFTEATARGVDLAWRYLLAKEVE